MILKIPYSYECGDNNFEWSREKVNRHTWKLAHRKFFIEKSVLFNWNGILTSRIISYITKDSYRCRTYDTLLIKYNKNTVQIIFQANNEKPTYTCFEIEWINLMFVMMRSLDMSYSMFELCRTKVFKHYYLRGLTSQRSALEQNIFTRIRFICNLFFLTW